MLLVRKNNEVFFNEQKLTIVEQGTKGPGKEVVKIKGLEGSNGQQWVSLSKLKEGENRITCQGREVVTTSKYILTPEESKEVKDLQTKIDSIINNAKNRYVPKPELNIEQSVIDSMTEEEIERKIDEVRKYYTSLKKK